MTRRLPAMSWASSLKPLPAIRFRPFGVLDTHLIAGQGKGHFAAFVLQDQPFQGLVKPEG